MFHIAVIGFGYWGPNIIRNFAAHPDCHVKYICDMNNDARNRAKDLYPNIEVIDNQELIFQDSEIDIVAIVTPVSTHFELAKKALESGKHIFLEKPMVGTVKEADELIRLAKQKGLIGVVDHTFLFTGAVRKIKEIVDSGEIGEITYFDSVRVNLGLFQHDVDVIWDLAPHDLSILFYITKERPVAVTASGVSHIDNSLVDVAYLVLHYQNAMISSFHVNWLSPIKVRKILVGGTKKMIVYDDMATNEKIKVYDKGITVTKPEEIHKLLVQYRSGNMVAPNFSTIEALKHSVNSFINQINGEERSSLNDLNRGKEIVEILAASDQSLQKKERVTI
ncbi:MAG: Gfo/Idh/MocA family protein [Candidatus Scalindua sp.]